MSRHMQEKTRRMFWKARLKFVITPDKKIKLSLSPGQQLTTSERYEFYNQDSELEKFRPGEM